MDIKLHANRFKLLNDLFKGNELRRSYLAMKTCDS